MPPPHLRRVLQSLEAYRPGARPEPGQADVARLASNEHPLPALTAVTDAIGRHLAALNRYPDPAASELVAALAERHRLVPSRVVVGCGSVQLLQELITATCEVGDEVAYGWRSFEAYPTLTRLAGATARPVPLAGVHIDLERLADNVGPRTRLVILCSPNNPLGPTLAHHDVQTFLGRIPQDVLVVLDEAYAEYVTDPDAVVGPDLLRDHSNVVVLRTFSKAYGLAGLRVGYALVAHDAVAAALRQVHLPFAVSAPAQAGALAALQHSAEVMAGVAMTIRERDMLACWLRASGWDIPSAQGNFVWLPAGAASSRLAETYREAEILTRCFDGEGIRITIGTPGENERVAAFASEWLAGSEA